MSECDEVISVVIFIVIVVGCGSRCRNRHRNRYRPWKPLSQSWPAASGLRRDLGRERASWYVVILDAGIRDGIVLARTTAYDDYDDERLRPTAVTMR